MSGDFLNVCMQIGWLALVVFVACMLCFVDVVVMFNTAPSFGGCLSPLPNALMLWRLAEAASTNKAGMLQAARNIITLLTLQQNFLGSRAQPSEGLLSTFWALHGCKQRYTLA
jgi:hypothetical protein